MQSFLPLRGLWCPSFWLKIGPWHASVFGPGILGSFHFTALLLEFGLVLNSVPDTCLLWSRSWTTLIRHGRVARPQSRCRLLSLRFVEVGRLAGPAFISELGQSLELLLPDQVLLLLFDCRSIGAYVTEPLMPLCYEEDGQSQSWLIHGRVKRRDGTYG